MDKVALFTFGHWGSTLPLAKKLSEKGYIVDYYIECFDGTTGNIEATDMEAFKPKGFIGNIPIDHLGSLKDYCPNVRIRYVNLISPMISHKYLAIIASLLNCILIFFYSFNINKQHYSNIFLVGRYTAYHHIWYHKFLRSRIYTCLHEIHNHMNPNYKKTPYLLSFLFNNKCPIIVHSENNFREILKYKSCDINNIFCINFGLFETWSYIKGYLNEYEQVGDNYILLIGGITPYKGLDILLSAIKKLNALNREFNFVVAGGGNVPELQELNHLKNVTVINRFLDNSEFSYLIQHSHAVVCPYKTMSQSGIPQTAFVFGKPVIVSNLSGFNGVVCNNKNGLVFHTGDSDELASAILNIYDDNVYKSLKDNVSNFGYFNQDYDWNIISAKYMELIKM